MSPDRPINVADKARLKGYQWIALLCRATNELQSAGVRCWFAPEDMKIGDKLHHSIDTAIRVRDKLLLILSESSLSSSWVEREVSTALKEESAREGQLVLFPIRIDDAVMETRVQWAAKLRQQRNIGDFRDSGNDAKWDEAFERLLRDLRGEPSGEAQ